MSKNWTHLPVVHRDWDFFTRQKDLFPDWVRKFDDDWHKMRFDDSVSRFDHNLDRIKRDMHRLDNDASHIQVQYSLALLFIILKVVILISR